MTSDNNSRQNIGSPIKLAIGLALGPAIGLGLARFAYALVLPDMKAALDWSFTTAGVMNTLNALGYLIGATVASVTDRWLGGKRAFIYATVVTTVSILATALSANFLLLSLWRLISGMSGAISFITGAGLAAEIGRSKLPNRSSLVLGIYFSGGGIGIALSGIVVPNLLASLPATSGWKLGWVALGVLGLASMAICIPAAIKSTELPVAPGSETSWPKHKLKATLIAYGLFGVGYIAYMTFIIAYLKNQGDSPSELSSFWIVLGIFAIIASFTWSKPIERLKGGKGLALVLAMLTFGSLLPLLSNDPIFVYGSAVIFGGSFLSVVTAVTTIARRSLQPHHWTPAIALLTVVFAIGQSVGPVLAGVLSNGPTGVKLGLEISSVVLGIGGITGALQRQSASTELRS